MQYKQAVSIAFSRHAVDYARLCYGQDSSGEEGHGEETSYSLQAQAAALIKPYLKRCDVLLDLGCGPAVHTAMLRNYCERYWGLDISPAMLDMAKQQILEAPVPEVRWFEGDAEALCFDDNTIDLIYSNMAVQWCESPERVLSEAMRVLKPGGRLLMTTLVKGSTELLTDLHRQGLLAHANQYPELSAWRQQADVLGFTLVKAEIKSVTTQHETPSALLKSLKQIGANTRRHEHGKERGSGTVGHGLKTKSWLFQLYGEIEKRRQQGAIPLNYRVAYLVVEK